VIDLGPSNFWFTVLFLGSPGDRSGPFNFFGLQVGFGSQGRERFCFCLNGQDLSFQNRKNVKKFLFAVCRLFCGDNHPLSVLSSWSPPFHPFIFQRAVECRPVLRCWFWLIL
jgi:hypothetical protein